MRGTYAFSTGLRRRAGAPLGWERGFDSLSGVLSALVLDYSGVVGGQFFNGTDSTLSFDDIHTYAGASLATQLDDAGLVVFKPHNLLKGSEAFESVTHWVQDGTASVVGGAADPNGGTTAVTVTEDTATSTHGLVAPSANRPVQKPGESYHLEVYIAKASTRRFLMISANTNAPTLITFDVQTGTITDTVAGGGTVMLDSGVEDVGGFYRVWHEATTNASTSLVTIIRGSDSSTNANTGPSYLGDGSTFIIWGGQLNRHPMASANDTYAATYVPTTSDPVFQHRLDHDKDGNRIGLVIEELRTNDCLQSNGFDTTWSPVRNDLTGAKTTGPDGVSDSGWMLKDDASTGTNTVIVTQAFTVATTTTYTFSVYAKKDQLNWLAFRVQQFTTPIDGNTYFDLLNGVVGAQVGSGQTARIEDAGNGWYRCSVTFTTDGTDESGSIFIYVAEANGDNVVDLDGTSSIFIFGAQFEKGARPSTYIPTTTVTVSRAAETCSVATSSFGFVAATGTYFASYNLKRTPGVAQCWLHHQTDGSNRVILRAKSDNTFNAFNTDGGNNFYDISGGTPADGDGKLALAYALNDYSFYVDGNSIGTDTSGTPAMTPNNLFIGYRDGTGSRINSHLKSVAYYPSRISNSDLDAMTT